LNCFVLQLSTCIALLYASTCHAIFTLSLHDALPIYLFAHKTILENVTLGPLKVKRMKSGEAKKQAMELLERVGVANQADKLPAQDRKSTRLNSSHVSISYAVFCLKKKKNKKKKLQNR